MSVNTFTPSPCAMRRYFFAHSRSCGFCEFSSCAAASSQCLNALAILRRSGSQKATIGVLYSVSMILLLTAIGVVFFRETLNYYEIAGLVMAIASLVLLMRFS